MIKGVYTALITPFTKEDTIDFNALKTLIEKQLIAGVDGLVLLGTTAETACLNAEEKDSILAHAVEVINRRVPIIIGAGTNCTASTVEAVRSVKKYNPQAVLIVTPYYNKPNPAGLIAHYQSVAAEGVPIVLYHIPGRTGLKVPFGVMQKILSAVPQIIGVKESDYDMSHVTDMAVSYSKQIRYICGNDDLFPQYLACNAAGIISAAGNVLAPAFVQMYRAFTQGNTQAAFDLFAKAYPLIKACYLETNPTCSKYMLSALGVCGDRVRAPLAQIDPETKLKVDAALAATDKSLLI